MSENTTGRVLESSMKSGARAGKNAVGHGIALFNTARFFVNHPLIAAGTAIAIAVVIFSAVLVGGTSSAQLASTYYLTPENEDRYLEPKEEELHDSLWSEEHAMEDTRKLMEVIAASKEEDRESTIGKIRKAVEKLGLDSEEVEKSMSSLMDEGTMYMEEAFLEPVKADLSIEPEKGVLQNFEISPLSERSRSYFSFEHYLINWNRGTTQYRIFNSGNVYTDPYGFAKYRNEDGTEDYIIALGSYFGKTGNRYRITFDNGTALTFLKGDAKADCDTDPSGMYDKRNYSVIEFLVDQNRLDRAARYSGNCGKCSSGLFNGKIVKIELIEGEVSTSTGFSGASSDFRILAAYSVSLSNSELVRNRSLTSTIASLISPNFEYVGDTYTDSFGNSIPIVWFGDNAGQINYEKELKERLKKFTKKNSFFRYSFESDASGNVKMYPYTVTVEKEVINEETGEPEIVPEEITKHYVVPILGEKDINEILYDMFEIKPDEIYLNSGGSATNREAINTMAQETQALLCGDVSDSSVIISEMSGVFAWPAPGVYYITSAYGYRNLSYAKASKNHKGIDIGAPMNTPIVAVEEGTVTLARWYAGYGNCVMIEHPNGFKSVYGHLNSIQVTAGQTVAKGQQIGLSGTTGNSNGPHLHIEIHCNGTEVNPLNYIVNPETAGKLTFKTH